jgi:hypothetical protein
VTEAGLQLEPVEAVSGAPSACATSVLIGVTWLTSATVLPACRLDPGPGPREHPLLDRAERLAAARRVVQVAEPRLHLLGVLLGDLDEGHARPRCRTPSRRSRRRPAPPACRDLGDDLGGLPGAAYGRGDDDVDLVGDGGQPLAVACTWRRPRSLSPGLAEARPPEKRLSVVWSVSPWRTRMIRVGAMAGKLTPAAGGRGRRGAVQAAALPPDIGVRCPTRTCGPGSGRTRGSASPRRPGPWPGRPGRPAFSVSWQPPHHAHAARQRR